MNIAMSELTAPTEADYGIRIAPETVRVERLLPGPIERVWQYLTDAQLRAQWLAGGEIAACDGGQVALLFNNTLLTEDDDPPPPKYAQFAGGARLRGTVTACDPPRLLAYVWDDGEAPSHVRFELDPHGAQVRLVVTHSRLASRDEMLSVAAGWHVHLDILRERMTGATPDGFWRRHTRLEAEYDQRLS